MFSFIKAQSGIKSTDIYVINQFYFTICICSFIISSASTESVWKTIPCPFWATIDAERRDVSCGSTDLPSEAKKNFTLYINVLFFIAVFNLWINLRKGLVTAW